MSNTQSIKPEVSARISSLRHKTLNAERYLSVEQAKIITGVYRENENMPVILKRAHAFSRSLLEMPVTIDPEELIVGNRTPGIKAGVVFPEAGISWIMKELDILPARPQDPFKVRKEDAAFFIEHIEPFWRGKTLEDDIYKSYGNEINSIEKVVKVNQKDHAQGHICPKAEDWLRYGPAGLLAKARQKFETASGNKKLFYESSIITLKAASLFMKRYGDLAASMNLQKISLICKNLSENPPSDFREAVQSVWFLFVMLHMESNASSFSPGRMDQYLFPFYSASLGSGIPNQDEAQEIIDALFIKFNHIVYMRNSHSAMYFAGFPIGFNITLGGQTNDGRDATNELSYLFLKAQEHVRLPQPNLTARLHNGTPDSFIKECTRIIGLGTGMPQIVNDESIIPSLVAAGIEKKDSLNYALVGCVEISPQGNFLGWSDAAMFNMVKALELTLNNGKCMIAGDQTGLETGTLDTFTNFPDFESAFEKQLDHFIGKMISACEIVEKAHQQHLPSPFLSSVVDDCFEQGNDVTCGGAKYNMSGIQAIQVANVADSMAVIKKLVFDDKSLSGETLLKVLKANFRDEEIIRQRCLNNVPKYGNDVAWVDELGAKWVRFFAERLGKYTNFRGGPYKMGLYTVSAHMPMGKNVGATPDGRYSGAPLADGGLSPMYGQDKTGPTAVLNSVARIPSWLAPNGTLLNMKFMPSIFRSEDDRDKFSSFLKTFISLPVHHVQFNVVTGEDLLKAKRDPQSYRGLTIRVAGYTAFFTELAEDLQDEIIKRTTHGKYS